ncbi:hypothetical protein [Spiroplasma cantharicola]|uniref:ABC transporter ATP-binding protein n=1 Tax=Spiroplasma cantharicola TaxID=362837 RepID=A0A0M4JRL7_9MOLU|nr:hypothetical protein [Spiroplasma cantharicola]ALD66035.1 hypothetical protein SCANT_v1c01250 [Spiroplasma cantharicola]
MDFSLYTISAYNFLLYICIMMGINKKEGRTIIITVHNIDEINEVIDNYLIINSGKLIFSGSKNKLDLYNKIKYIQMKNLILLSLKNS